MRQPVELQFQDGIDLAVAEDQRAEIAGGEAGAIGGKLRVDAAAGQVDAVLGGVERDAGELGAAQRDAAVRKSTANRFSRASARELDWRITRITVSRWSSAIW